MVRKFTFLALILATNYGLASPFSVNGQKIKSVSTGWGGEAVYVITEGALPAGADCGGGNRFLITPNTPMYKEILSMLLTSVQNKNTVDLYVDGCNSTSMQIKSITISG
ncbi:hypothetical protein [Xanthomonas melonis]|uniref:hypothetical protein n=1 Tax=Xanthomonas melonis TaxID=56456 RepID=UPI0011B090F8|nr:hypothetical protein [Xanthomonas melonis]MCC4601680.1 hypothetical protein [Xanthomonas melonis]